MLTEKSVDGTPAFVEEPMAKAVVEMEEDGTCTDRPANGEEVPTPTSPLPCTVRKVRLFEEEATWKSGVVWVVVAWTERLANGVVDPNPSLPVLESKMN